MDDQPFISHINQQAEMIAGDRSRLRELMHPDRHPVNVHFSLAYAYLEPHEATSDHQLAESETYYILAGQGTMFINNTAIAVQAGSYYYIPPRCYQWLRNDGASRLEFLCIVDPPWTAEGEVIR